MPFRFVHTADVHLDSPLRSLALRSPEVAEIIGNATRQAFENVIELCLHEQVDALLLAGDLYDGDQTSMKTARFLGEQMRLLHEAGIAVFVIRGNHDALSRITKEVTYPPNVHLFSGRATPVAVQRPAAEVPVTVHGLSFTLPHAPDSLLDKYRPPVGGAINIGLMHTSLDGAPGHDIYAPCSLSKLDAHGFDYWALGHIHKRSVARGKATVVMPGMPQGRDIGESGAKSATLVTIGDDRRVTLEERVTSVAQFELVEVGLTGTEDWRDAVAAIHEGLRNARAQAVSEHLVARLRLTGPTPLAWRLRRDPDLLQEETVAHPLFIGRTWLDKIVVECRAPFAASAAGDPVAELRRVIGSDVLGSPSYREEIAAIAAALGKELPPECKAMLGADEAAFDAILDALAAEGAEEVLARLQGDAGAG
jgi:DNA repair exonuclease SbcCD nuclease subunit